MVLNNETPFALGTMIWEDAEGRPRLTVILKGTFSIGHNEAAAFAEQPFPIFAADVPYGDDPAAPPRFESDMAPFKPRADVVLVGRAYVPPGRRADNSIDVTLRVGSLEKTIRVFGDRAWSFPSKLAVIPEISRPEPFTTMDLVYERAFGGIDGPAARYCPENLAGTGFIGDKSRDSIHGKALPNLEDPEALIDSWSSRPKPVGFGFYGRGWQPRLKFAGTPRDDPDPGERARGLPRDFSYEFFNAAHPDLQVRGYLQGNEDVKLRRLSPDFLTEFRLPGVTPRVTIARRTTPPGPWIESQLAEGRRVTIEDVPATEETLPVVLDTLVLVPDESRFYVVFRGVCPLDSLEIPEIASISVTTN